MAFRITDECSGCMRCAPQCPTAAITGRANRLHSIDPARCVDCGACGAVCPEGAVVDHRGDLFALGISVLGPKHPRARVRALDCTGCGECADACAFDALEMIGAETLRRAVVVERRCVGCAGCELACTRDAIEIVRGRVEVSAPLVFE